MAVLQTLQHLSRGKNNEYTLIFFVFVKRNIISCCGNAEQTADVCTKPFPYLMPTKNPTALPKGIEPTSLVCYQVQKQALSHNTSINRRNRYCLPVRSSSSLTSFDKMSKKITCSSDEIFFFFDPTAIMIISLSRAHFHLLFL